MSNPIVERMNDLEDYLNRVHEVDARVSEMHDEITDMLSEYDFAMNVDEADEILSAMDGINKLLTSFLPIERIFSKFLSDIAALYASDSQIHQVMTRRMIKSTVSSIQTRVREFPTEMVLIISVLLTMVDEPNIID